MREKGGFSLETHDIHVQGRGMRVTAGHLLGFLADIGSVEKRFNFLDNNHLHLDMMIHLKK